jgi:hypothetical protein
MTGTPTREIATARAWRIGNRHGQKAIDAYIAAGSDGELPKPDLTGEYTAANLAVDVGLATETYGTIAYVEQPNDIGAAVVDAYERAFTEAVAYTAAGNIVTEGQLLAIITDVAPELPAYCTQTGGGCATIYLGEQINVFPTDAETEYPHYLAALGPGWFTDSSWTEGRFDLGDLYLGPDDFGESNDHVTITSVEQFREALIEFLTKPDWRLAKIGELRTYDPKVLERQYRAGVLTAGRVAPEGVPQERVDVCEGCHCRKSGDAEIPNSYDEPCEYSNCACHTPEGEPAPVILNTGDTTK